MTDEELILNVNLTPQERQEYLTGSQILKDLGWPPGCTIEMTQRAIAGLVPRYEGWESWLAYARTWAKADGEASAKRIIALEECASKAQ